MAAVPSGLPYGLHPPLTKKKKKNNRPLGYSDRLIFTLPFIFSIVMLIKSRKLRRLQNKTTYEIIVERSYEYVKRLLGRLKDVNTLLVGLWISRESCMNMQLAVNWLKIVSNLGFYNSGDLSSEPKTEQPETSPEKQKEGKGPRAR
jgi:hypothetical protein